MILVAISIYILVVPLALILVEGGVGGGGWEVILPSPVDFPLIIQKR